METGSGRGWFLMGLADEVNEAVDLMAPQVGLTAKVAEIIAWAALVLLAVGVAGWVIWKLFFASHQAEVKHEAAQAQAEHLVGGAQQQAGAKASNIVADNATKETIIHETTRDHYVEITKQPGAGDPVSDAVWDAFVRSVCVRSSAASLPDCQRLPGAGPQ